MGQVSTSTTITFAIVSDDSSAISVELDDAANNGKSTFQPGDTAHFMVYTNPADLSVSIDTTIGSVVANGTKSITVEEQLQFVQSDEETLGKLPSASVSTTWIGRAGGSPVVSGTSVKLPATINGVLKCIYATTVKSYRLSGVTIPTGQDEIQALIVVSAAT